MKAFTFAAGITALVLTAGAAGAQLQLTPFTYDPGEVCNEEAKWVYGGVDGATDYALSLKKGCTTATEASAGAEIVTDLEGEDVSELTTLSFAYRNGGHCGAGAPRFNVVVDGTTYFLGCSGGTHSEIDEDWTLVEFGAAEFAAAGIPATGTIEDIYIVFDEGTDTPAGGTIGTAGEVLIDQITINDAVAGMPDKPLTKEDCKNGGWMRFTNPPYANQGQCVSSVVSNRGGQGRGRGAARR